MQGADAHNAATESYNIGAAVQRQVHVERCTLLRLIHQRDQVFTSHIPILHPDATLAALHTHVRAHSQPVPHTQLQHRYSLNTKYFVHEQKILDKRQQINVKVQEAATVAAAVATAAAVAAAVVASEAAAAAAKAATAVAKVATKAAALATKLQQQTVSLQGELNTQEKETCMLQFLLQQLNDLERGEKLQDIPSPP